LALAGNSCSSGWKNDYFAIVLQRVDDVVASMTTESAFAVGYRLIAIVGATPSVALPWMTSLIGGILLRRSSDYSGRFFVAQEGCAARFTAHRYDDGGVLITTSFVVKVGASGSCDSLARG